MPGDVAEMGAEVTPQPALLHFLLVSRKCTVGELVDLANGLPREWVGEIARKLTDSIPRTDREESSVRRRRLVLLGALINRMVFEIEGVPKDRGAGI